MSNILYPYSRPDLSLFEWSIDQLLIGEVNHGSVSAVEGWTYQSATTVEVVLRVDSVDGLRAQIGLGVEDQLVWVVRWRCKKTAIRGCSKLAPLLEGPFNRLKLDLDPARLGGRLEVEPAVLLAKDSSSPLPSPQQAGSILWSDRRNVDLEGSGDRFSLAATDFKAAGYPVMSPWLLDWRNRDLHSSASDAMVVILNTGHRAFDELQAATDKDNFHQKLLVADIERQLVDGALSHDDDLDGVDEWPIGSLGSALRAALTRAFPDSMVGDIRRMRSESPGRFHADVMHSVELGA